MLEALKLTSLRRFAAPAILAGWLLALTPGVRYLLSYETTPGKAAAAPEYWPSNVPATGDARIPILVVALHPMCSCSRATLTELEEAASEFHHPYNALFLIDQPRGAQYVWQQVSYYRDAQRSLNASVVLDEDGQLAARFGAFTSGEVLYYSAAEKDGRRRLLFSGGVTGSRGMVGPNAGITALKLAVNQTAGSQQGSKPMTHSPVFGCGFSALSEKSREQRTQ